MGYLTFANHIEKTMQSLPTPSLIQAVRLVCDNCILLMDEIHSTRQIDSGTKTKEDDIKKIRPVLEAVARYARSTKMVLLSATPMYNDVREIEWIVNLMRWNQGLSSMSWKQWYNPKTNDWLAPQSKSIQYCMMKTKGFISYIRGENPYTFPRRLYPVSTPKVPIQTKQIRGITLVQSKISKEHQTILTKLSTESNDSFSVGMIQNTLSVQNKLSELDTEWNIHDGITWSPKCITCWNTMKYSNGPVFIYS